MFKVESGKINDKIAGFINEFKGEGEKIEKLKAEGKDINNQETNNTLKCLTPGSDLKVTEDSKQFCQELYKHYPKNEIKDNNNYIDAKTREAVVPLKFAGESVELRPLRIRKELKYEQIKEKISEIEKIKLKVGTDLDLDEKSIKEYDQLIYKYTTSSKYMFKVGSEVGHQAFMKDE